MFLGAQCFQIEESELKKQVLQLQYEDIWVSSMPLTLFLDFFEEVESGIVKKFRKA